MKIRTTQFTARHLFVIILLAGLAALALWIFWPAGEGDGGNSGGGGGGGGKNRNQAPSVEVVQVQRRSVPRTLAALGKVVPIQTLAVRSQVSGRIVSIGFADGDIVNKGQILFRLDSRPFQASVDAASAALQKDLAAKNYAESKVTRLLPQFDAGAISADELAQARSDASQAAALVAVDRANLAKARLDLEYSTIRAPFRAKSGAASLRLGALVDANGTLPLVTLNQLTPVDVQFAIPENDLSRVRASMEGASRLSVTATSLESQGNQGASPPTSTTRVTPVEGGRLVFVDNMVDAQTGTVSLRGRFPNPAAALWPGEDVRVSLVLGVDSDALVVPASAVQQGAKGTFVFAVKAGKAALRPVSILRYQNDWAVIAQGVAAGEQIILRVPRTLRDGGAVKIAGPASTAPASSAKKQSGSGSGTGGGSGAHRNRTATAADNTQ